jgi:hypothetical protein
MHSPPIHSKSIYSHSIQKPHSLFGPHISPGCIHSPKNLTPQTSHILFRLYTQSNLKPHSTVVPLTPSVCIHSPYTNHSPQFSHSHRHSVVTVQSKTSLYSHLHYSVSLYSESNLKLHFIVIPLNPSVCNHIPITNLTPQSCHSLRQTVFTIQ